MATIEPLVPFATVGGRDLNAILGRMLRPAVGFNRPRDVLKDEDLSAEEKRAVLSSWASDACAVDGKPYLRWMLGCGEPVPLLEVLEALARLEPKNAS